METAHTAPEVVVIGAGLGGLVSGLLLARSGYRVTIVEKNGTVGGKMGFLRGGEYSFDTGPSLLTMPFVLEDLFRSIGESLDDHLALQPVDPVCRYHYPDGIVLNAWRDPARWEAEVISRFPRETGSHERFMRHGRNIYDAAAEPFLFSPMRLRDMIHPRNLFKHLPSVTRLDAFRTLSDAVEDFFRDDHLHSLYNRFATYNGSSPYKTPATLSIIPFIEFTFGGWYIRGGMYELVRVLHRLADRNGVKIRLDTEVKEILIEDGRATAVRTGNGEIIAASLLICNADVLHARASLLKRDARRDTTGGEASSSGCVLFLGVDRTYDQLAHHTIFFSSDYRREFRQIFDEQRPADEPTVYVCNSSRSDPSHAPAGHSNLFVLVNTPPVADEGAGAASLVDQEFYRTRYLGRIMTMLEKKGLQHLRAHVRYEEMYTPFDLRERFHAFRGAIYGSSSNSRMAAFRRPRNRDRHIRNLFHAGGGSHPGGGIPLVLLSAKIASKLVQEAYPLNRVRSGR